MTADPDALDLFGNPAPVECFASYGGVDRPSTRTRLRVLRAWSPSIVRDKRPIGDYVRELLRVCASRGFVLVEWHVLDHAGRTLGLVPGSIGTETPADRRSFLSRYSRPVLSDGSALDWRTVPVVPFDVDFGAWFGELRATETRIDVGELRRILFGE